MDFHTWESFPACECLKQILYQCSFNDALSLKSITEKHLSEIEEYVDSIRGTISDGFGCCHMDIYKNQAKFRILPAHKIVILNWPAEILPKTGKKELFSLNDPEFTPILRELISCAKTNFMRDPKGHVFSEKLIDFSIYMYIIAGKASYEVLASNLSLPTSGTICKSYFSIVFFFKTFDQFCFSVNRIHREKERVIEGELRCSQLVKYLKSIDSPNSVFLSEDGSGVVRKIVYDAHLNQLVGLVHPFNDETGMPKLFAFQAD